MARPKKQTDEKPVLMWLPVKLDEHELAARAQELAAAERDMDDVEVRQAAYVEAVKELEGEHTEARARVRRLAEIVRDKAEKREVEVRHVRSQALHLRPVVVRQQLEMLHRHGDLVQLGLVARPDELLLG